MHSYSTSSSKLPPQFEAILDRDEQIQWSGQAKMLPFVLTGIPFLIVGCLWGAMDYFGFIRHMSGAEGMRGFMIPFFALHLFPFWGSILNMFRLMLVHKNTFYAFSNKRLLIRSGFWGTDFKVIDYDRIQDLTVTVNPVENMMGVGTIKAFTGAYGPKGRPVFDRFVAIADPYEVYRRLKQVSVDVKTDGNYPNAMCPAANPGYQTEYTERR
jgi:hypothetical protein